MSTKPISKKSTSQKTEYVSPQCDQKGFVYNYTFFYIGILVIVIGATIFGMWLTPVLDTSIATYWTNFVVVILVIGIGAILMILSGLIGRKTKENCVKKSQ